MTIFLLSVPMLSQIPIDKLPTELSQSQVDKLTAEEFSHFLSSEEEFCNENPHTIENGSQNRYASEILDSLGLIDKTSHGDASWIGSLASMMSQDTTFGLQDTHCISTAVF